MESLREKETKYNGFHHNEPGFNMDEPDAFTADRRRFLKTAAASTLLFAPSLEDPFPADVVPPAVSTEQKRAPDMPMTTAGGLSLVRLGRMHEVMAAYVDRGEIPGMVTAVSRHGEVHVEAIGSKTSDGGDRMRRNTIFRIASLTKPITAAAAMILVEECRLRLDDPVDPWLPELANRRVLRRIDSEIDDTVPAHRPITLRDLLTLKPGTGVVMAMPGTYPIQKAMEDVGLAPGPDLPAVPPDELMRRYRSLPLIYQPGEKWLYNSGSDILGVLIARASGQSLESLLRERIFEPLSMTDTGFSVPEMKIDRLTTFYRTDPRTGELSVYDEARNGRFTRPPIFESGAGGLVSTVDDYLAFCQMMLNKGTFNGQRILSRPSVELMTTDHLTPDQKAGSELILGKNRSWGFGMAVYTAHDNLYASPGRFGWEGGYGTSAYVDPREELIGILLTQRLMDSPEPPPVFRDFWTSVYQAIDD